MTDNVNVKDFASVLPATGMIETIDDETPAAPLKRVEQLRQRFVRRIRPEKPLARSIGIRFGDHGHRTSIAYGGKLEYPELELLPVSKPLEAEAPRPWMTSAIGRKLSDNLRQGKKPSLGHFYDGSQLTISTEASGKSTRSKRSRRKHILGSSVYSGRPSENETNNVYDGNLLFPSLAGTKWSQNTTQHSRAVIPAKSFDGSSEHLSAQGNPIVPHDHAKGESSTSLARKVSDRSMQSNVYRRVPTEVLYDAYLLHPRVAEERNAPLRSESTGQQQQHRRSTSGKSNGAGSVVVLGSSCDSLSQYSVRSRWRGLSEELQRSTKDLNILAGEWSSRLDSNDHLLIGNALRAAEDAWK